MEPKDWLIKFKEIFFSAYQGAKDTGSPFAKHHPKPTPVSRRRGMNHRRSASGLSAFPSTRTATRAAGPRPPPTTPPLLGLDMENARGPRYHSRLSDTLKCRADGPSLAIVTCALRGLRSRDGHGIFNNIESLFLRRLGALNKLKYTNLTFKEILIIGAIKINIPRPTSRLELKPID